MKDYEFLEPAQIELEEEVKYYNERSARYQSCHRPTGAKRSLSCGR
jgi:hypothetical protein